VSAPLIALSGVTLADAAASATLSINAAALALGSLGGTGRSLLGVCAADRPVEFDARRRSCVGNNLDQCRFAAPQLCRQHSRSKLLLSLSEAWARPVGCDARRRSCVGNALDQRCCSRSPLLGVSTADRPVGCDARRRSCVCNALDQRRFAAAAASATLSINAASPRRSCVGNAPDQSCCSRSRRLGRHRPLAARCLHR